MTAARPRRRRPDRAGALLQAIAAPGAALVEHADGGFRLLTGGAGDVGSPPRVVPAADVEALARADLLARGPGGWAPTAAGRARLRREAADDPWRAQHLEIGAEGIAGPDGARRTVTVVANESPLAWLRRRRGADGAPLVGGAQFRAGERLRADFERAGLAPRVTLDWEKLAAGRTRRRASPAQMLDSVAEARRRVDAVWRSLGPELGSLLIDVCCLLVGLEDAERRRGWPRRSAKVVLGIGLDRLAAHYGLSETASGPDGPSGLRHWGAEGYRPRVDGA